MRRCNKYALNTVSLVLVPIIPKDCGFRILDPGH